MRVPEGMFRSSIAAAKTSISSVGINRKAASKQKSISQWSTEFAMHHSELAL